MSSRRFVIHLLAVLSIAGCAGDDGSDRASGADADAGPQDTTSDAADSTSGDDTAGADVVPDGSGDGTDAECPETAGGALGEGVVWLELEPVSDDVVAMSDRALTTEYETQGGETVDLNAIEYFGANGFYLETPGTVVGASARFTNIAAGGGVAELWAWPDFSSDGYVFAHDRPLGRYTRCVEPEDDGEWVTFAFDEPIVVEQPLHVFVGSHREALIPDGDGVVEYPVPELLFEAERAESEPWRSGIRWPDVDRETMYEGRVTPWFNWEVRLAVVPFDDPGPRPFGVVEGFRASSRVAWGDYDNDGDDDLMTNGPTLYRNDDGEFVDVTADAIPGGVSNGTSGGAWGDYDNDGCLDYFGQGRADTLLRSRCDGTFVDVTADSGIDDTQTVRDCDGDGEPEPSPTEGAAWLDYDGDGLLDLYLANYECSSDFDYFNNYDDRMFRNAGDGTFEPAPGVDLVRERYAGRGVTPADFDIDGDVDLLVSNYRLDPNAFYVNDRGSRFEDEARLRGVQGANVDGSYGHTIGSVFGDVDGDGDFDLVQANLAHPFYYHFSDRTQVLINDGWGVFTDEAESRGIYYRETHSNPTLFDADEDGDLDLFVTCVYAGRDSDFYENDGTGNFALRNWESGLVVRNGWGGAASDFDNDGDVDIVAYDLFENRGAPEGHWLEVRAVGVGTNTSAIGAVVELETDGHVQVRQVSGGSGTGCQDSMYLHFGLGDDDTVDEVRVRFPYGPTITLEAPTVDTRWWVYSDGETHSGWAPPR